MEPRQPAGFSSRDKILWAAATMLGEESGSTPSVRAVPARAGVSAGSVQHHFPTQRELMDEALVPSEASPPQIEIDVRRTAVEYVLNERSA